MTPEQATHLMRRVLEAVPQYLKGYKEPTTVANGSNGAPPKAGVLSIETLRSLQPQDGPLLCAPFNVVVSPDLPKIQISNDCPLSDDFRAEMNAWCLSFFGTANIVSDTEVLVVGVRTLMVNPRTFKRLIKDFAIDQIPNRTHPYTNPGAFW